MDKVQQAYWDEYVTPKLNAFCKELKSDIEPYLQSPKDLDGLADYLNDHLKMCRLQILDELRVAKENEEIEKSVS